MVQLLSSGFLIPSDCTEIHKQRNNSGNSTLSLVSSMLLIIRKSGIVTDFILQSFLELIMEIIHIHIRIIGFSSDYCNNRQKFRVLDIERGVEDIM